RCPSCGSLYLEKVPRNIRDLYDENYFGQAGDPSGRNQEEGIGYEASYDTTYRDAEFYWAFRCADYLSQLLSKDGPRSSFSHADDAPPCCLDIGSATGRLLNVSKS